MRGFMAQRPVTAEREAQRISGFLFKYGKMRRHERYNTTQPHGW